MTHSQKYFVTDMLDYLERLCDSSTVNDLQRHFLHGLADDVAIFPSHCFYECPPEQFDISAILEFLDVHDAIAPVWKSNIRTFFFGHEE